MRGRYHSYGAKSTWRGRGGPELYYCKQIDDGQNLQEVQSVLSGFGELWEEGTLEERKALMAELVEDLRVMKDKVTLKLRFLEETEIPIKLGR